MPGLQRQCDAHFLDQTKEELQQISTKISEMFPLALESFITRKTDHLEEIYAIHKEINDLLIYTRDVHIVRLSSNMYSIEVSKSLYSVLFSLQRVADHLVNVAFSIRSDTGSKTEAFELIKREKKK